MDRELKKGSTELLILSLLEGGPATATTSAARSSSAARGVVELHVASLYPLLYRLERRGWVAGRWVERPGSAGAATTVSPRPAAACSRTRRTPGARSWPP